MTPLHLGARAGNSKLCEWLCGTHKAWTDAAAGGSLLSATALMFAALYGYVDVMAVLLRHDAGIDIQDTAGCTALHYAAQYGQTRACLFLLRVGASRTLRNKDSRTPAQVADSSDFKVTCQSIMTFAPQAFKADPMVLYHREKVEAADRGSGGMAALLGGKAKFATKLTDLGSVMGNAGSGLQVCCVVGRRPCMFSSLVLLI